MNPLSGRCPAMSKRTGKPCQQWVVGGGVCFHHGGNAKQVRVAREARIAAAEAQAAAVARGEAWVPRHPGEVLLASVAASDELQAALLTAYRTGEVTPALVRALGEAIDRSARTAKTALDAGVEERMVQIREAPAREQADGFLAIMAYAFAGGEEPPAEAAGYALAAWDRFLVAASAMGDGRPQDIPRLSQQVVGRWLEARRSQARDEAAAEQHQRVIGVRRDAELTAAMESGHLTTLATRRGVAKR